ncbi:MAG: AI-2E family transporter [Erysipelotrichaceae bacterium]|nr:AI-2E family transporter [Erysipelotrichaceae bacterium]
MKLLPPRDPKYWRISFYALMTFILAYTFTKLADQFGTILIALQRFIGYMVIILKPLFIGMILAYVLYPVVLFIEKRLKNLKFYKDGKHHVRPLSVGLTMLALFAALTIISSVLVSAVNHELQFVRFDNINVIIKEITLGIYHFSESLEQLLSSLNITSNDLNSYIKELGNTVVNLLRNYGMSMSGFITNMAGVFTSMLFAIVFSVYFLLDADNLSVYWDNILHAFTPESFYTRVHVILLDADSVFSGYIRGQLIDAIFMMIIVSVALSFMNIRFGVLIGIMTGIANLIPYVGPFVAYGSTILVCVIGGDYEKLVIAMLVLLAIQAIDGNIVNPKLLSKSIEVHPMFVIVCLIVGSAIGGVWGMLFAVPVGALLKIQFERLMIYVMQSKQTSEDKKKEPPKGWDSYQ